MRLLHRCNGPGAEALTGPGLPVGRRKGDQRPRYRDASKFRWSQAEGDSKARETWAEDQGGRRSAGNRTRTGKSRRWGRNQAALL